MREALRKLEEQKKLVRSVPHKGPVSRAGHVARRSDGAQYALRALLGRVCGARVRAARQRRSSSRSWRRGENAARARATAQGQDGVLKAKASALRRVARQLRQPSGRRDSKQPVLAREPAARDLADASRPLPSSLREIDKLHKALKARDADAAQQLARQHVLNAEKAALRMLGEEAMKAVRVHGSSASSSMKRRAGCGVPLDSSTAC